MIEFVQGKVVNIQTEYIVIDHNGLGYRLYCPNPYVFEEFYKQSIQVYTYQHVRQDFVRLYGFQSEKERALFEKLLTVSGIGPKGALAILASGNPDQVVIAIEQEDEAFLVKFPGVGKKTARQMILDLKGKLEQFITVEQTLETDGPNTKLHLHNKQLEEAIEALRTLGYSERELKKVRPQLESKKLQTDEYIKEALQLMLK